MLGSREALAIILFSWILGINFCSFLPRISSFLQIALSFDTKNNDGTWIKNQWVTVDIVVPGWYDHIQTLFDVSVSFYIEFPHLIAIVDI